MILLIDNYDSFVYTLARLIKELGFEVMVCRNDKVSVNTIANELCPSHIVLSPGPCTPNEAGIALELVDKLSPLVPILGVCLGHQVIGQAMGAKIVKAKKPMHGKQSNIWHEGKGLFCDLEGPLSVARYHSLVIDAVSVPCDLEVHALSQENEVMAIKHKVYPTFGVQFHPESILSLSGFELLRRFLLVSK
jgi:anthranilate synthase/aminodeoxychorismate synthase-like glutamine amidotransferase